MLCFHTQGRGGGQADAIDPMWWHGDQHYCVAALPFGGVGASGTGFVNLFASLSLSSLLPFIWLLLLSSPIHFLSFLVNEMCHFRCYHGKEGFMNFSHWMACYEFKRKILPNIHLPFSESDVATQESYCKLPPNIGLTLKVVGISVGTAILWQLPWRAWRPTLLNLVRWVIQTLEPIKQE